MGRLRSENPSSPATVAVLQSFQQFCSVLFRRFVAAHNFKASSFFPTLDLHHELSAVCQGKFTCRVDEITNNTSNSPERALLTCNTVDMWPCINRPPHSFLPAFRSQFRKWLFASFNGSDIGHYRKSQWCQKTCVKENDSSTCCDGNLTRTALS